MNAEPAPETSPEPVPKAPLPGHCCRLSEELGELIRVAQGEGVTPRDLVDHVAARGHAPLVLFLALPFLQPIPLPGVSTPVGLAIACLGVLMALGRPPWLPRRWLDRRLPATTLVRVLRAGQAVLQRLERFVKPRGRWFHRHRWARPIAGTVIAVSGVELALPLPILFTNTMPALVIAITAVAFLEEDAVLAILGELLFLVFLAVFAAIVLVPFLGLRLLL